MKECTCGSNQTRPYPEPPRPYPEPRRERDHTAMAGIATQLQQNAEPAGKPPETGVLERLDQLAKSLEYEGECIDRLRLRTDAILRPCPEQEKNDCNLPVDCSPLSHYVEALQRRVNRNTAIIQELTRLADL